MNTSLTLVKEAIAYAKKSAANHYKKMLLPSFIYGITLVGSDILPAFTSQAENLSIMLALFFTLASIIYNLGIIDIAFHIEEGKPVSAWQALYYGRYILPFLLINFGFMLPLFTLILLQIRFASFTTPFTILFVVFVWTRISYFSYFIADRKISLWKSYVESFHATKGFFITVFILNSLELLLLILGLVCGFIGILWAVPFTTFMNTYIYRKVLNK